jgi:hypothetical protein
LRIKEQESNLILPEHDDDDDDDAGFQTIPLNCQNREQLTCSKYSPTFLPSAIQHLRPPHFYNLNCSYTKPTGAINITLGASAGKIKGNRKQ